MDFTADLCNLNSLIEKADLIITGEGSFDAQTMQGKAVQGVLERCRKLKKPAIVVCGISSAPTTGFDQVEVIDFVARFGSE
jgi:glycerate kinase